MTIPTQKTAKLIILIDIFDDFCLNTYYNNDVLNRPDDFDVGSLLITDEDTYILVINDRKEWKDIRYILDPKDYHQGDIFFPDDSEFSHGYILDANQMWQELDWDQTGGYIVDTTKLSLTFPLEYFNPNFEFDSHYVIVKINPNKFEILSRFVHESISYAIVKYDRWIYLYQLNWDEFRSSLNDYDVGSWWKERTGLNRNDELEEPEIELVSRICASEAKFESESLLKRLQEEEKHQISIIIHPWPNDIID